MKTIKFDDYEDFAMTIDEKYDLLSELDRYADVSVIAKYHDAKEIIKELIYVGYEIASLQIGEEEINEYWDEYVLSVNSDGIWAEPFLRKAGYFKEAATLTYIMSDCNSKVIPNVKSKVVFEVEIESDEDYDFEDECSCEDCPNYFDCGEYGDWSEDDEDEFAVSSDLECEKEFFVDGKKVNEKEYQKAKDEFISEWNKRLSNLFDFIDTFEQFYNDL